MLTRFPKTWLRWMCGGNEPARWMPALESEIQYRGVNTLTWRPIFFAGVVVIAIGMGSTGCMHTDTMQSTYIDQSIVAPFGGGGGSIEGTQFSRAELFGPEGVFLLDKVEYRKVRAHRIERWEQVPVIVQSISHTVCNVAVEASPGFLSNGRLYRQGVSPQGTAPDVIPPARRSHNVEQLLTDYLVGVATTSAGYRYSSRMRNQPGLYRTNAHYAYSRGATGSGVRIAVDDAPLDILTWDLRGRISFDGASILNEQGYAHQAQRAGVAFGNCDTPSKARTNNCLVWEINAGGNEDIVNQYGRYIIEQFGYPSKENTWWIRDTSQSRGNRWGELQQAQWSRCAPRRDGRCIGAAWYEIPALFDCNTYRYDDEDYEPCNNYDHGTQVATVAAGWSYGVAPGAIVVPLTGIVDKLDPFDEAQNRSYYQSGRFWSRVRSNRFTQSELDHMDQSWATDLAEHYGKFDIINKSYGPEESQPPTDSDSFREERDWSRYFPLFWAEVQQLNTPAADRVIEVHSAGNHGRSTNSSDWRFPSGEAARPYRYAGFRGHHITAVALDSFGREAEYTNRCGSLPDDWDVARDGRHYCVAAPGTGYAVVQGWREGEPLRQFNEGFSGTSFAAPVVAGSLALMIDYFTDPNGNKQLGNREIVLRLINTANNRGIYSDSAIYGAGLIDLDAATRPVGTASLGNDSISAPVVRSVALLPSAYGDLGNRMRDVLVATYDAWNAPFFAPASSFIRTRQSSLDGMIPRSEDRSVLNLTTDSLGLSRSRPTGHGEGLFLVGGTSSLGVVLPISGSVEVGALADTKSDQGAYVSGALGEAIRSGLIWTQFSRERNLSKRVTGWVTTTAGLGMPDYRRGMLDIGVATYTAWEVGLRTGGLQMSIGQPWRAESGTGALTYSTGRQPSGERLFGKHTFSLEPQGREVVLQLRYSEPLVLGRGVVQLGFHNDANHSKGKTEARFGLSMQWRW